jgi:hypothetical protein
MELDRLLDAVIDEASFLAFVDALRADLRTDSASWVNGSIEEFLEAALAWGETTKIGASQGLADASPWRRCAAFLYCGKMYE